MSTSEDKSPAQREKLTRLPQQQREKLLQWATDHQISGDDFFWSAIEFTALQHEFNLESVRELEAAQRSAVSRIHQTSLAATRALRLAAQAAQEEAAEGVTDEVRELMATETRRALNQVSQSTWLHKISHWAGPLGLGLAASLIAVGWFTYNQPTNQDLKIARAVRDAWPNLPASAQRIIADALK